MSVGHHNVYVGRYTIDFIILVTNIIYVGQYTIVFSILVIIILAYFPGPFYVLITIVLTLIIVQFFRHLTCWQSRSHSSCPSWPLGWWPVDRPWWLAIPPPPFQSPTTSTSPNFSNRPKIVPTKNSFQRLAIFPRGVHSARVGVQLANGTWCRCKPSLPRTFCTSASALARHNLTQEPHTELYKLLCRANLHMLHHCVQWTLYSSVHKLLRYVVRLKHFRSFILPFRDRAVTIPSTGGTLHLPGCRHFQE